MAIPILNHIDLRSVSELQNAILHKTTSASASDVEGKIIYDTGVNSIKFYDGSEWKTVGTAGGSVTSVAISGTDGIDVDSGSPITTSGTIVLGLSNIANDKLANSSITLTQGAGMAALGSVSLGGSLEVAVDGVLEDLDTLGAPTADGQIIVATGAGTFAYESGATLRSTINCDIAGTDNSTNVTLVTTSHDYLSIAGQAITLNEITTDDLAADAVTAAKLADNAVVTANIVDANVTTAKIADGDVTNAKLANSSLTIGDSTIALGGTDTSLTGLTDIDLTSGNKTIFDGVGSNVLTIGASGTTITIPGNLNVTGTTTTVDSTTIQITNSFTFEGSTADANETVLGVVDPTADRTINLPDASGTVALTSDLVANEKITKLLSGDGTTTTHTITHGFGTPIVSVQVLDYGDAGTGATYDVVLVEVQRNSDNAVDLIFASAPSATQDYLVLISKFPAAS